MYWSRNIYKVLLFTVIVIGLIVLAILGMKKMLPSSSDITARLTPSTATTKDIIYFKDSSTFAKQHRWLFGDGNIAFSAEGYHHYTQPGNYTVQLIINDRYIDTFLITINDTAKVVPLKDSVPVIEAPDIAMQFENITFRASAHGASQYRWRLGESNYIDSREPFVQYYYKQPGTYTVALYTDNSEYPVTHKITIVPSYHASEDSMLSIDGMYKKMEDDFKIHLQQIADGKSFNTHYYYLLKKYLCNNEKTVIKINNQKANDFNSYCLGLQFDKNVLIQSVKLSPAENGDCMKQVDVMQTRNP
ncbi:PKD domain-containing protein [Chitinophagaceae bacterium 26-R-25]|nr:PKD domain-containing protein [Chitinophagaceae bacterium 26-R-25]